MYRTQKIVIKKGHRLYEYFKEQSLKATNLYNTTNFYIRQFATARKFQKAFTPLFETQMSVFSIVEDYTSGTKYNPENNDWLNYGQLDYIFKTTKNEDYYNLPAHTNQHIIKNILANYKGFFESIKQYKTNPSLYLGRPKLPKYKNKNTLSTFVFSNQTCTIKENKYLRFPHTNEKINLSKLMAIYKDGMLKEVKVKPMHNTFLLCIVMEYPDDIEIFRQFEHDGYSIATNIFDEKHNSKLLNKYKDHTTLCERTLSIDMGLSNLCAIVNNFGARPLLIKGNHLKSVNQFYNKQMAEYRSLAKLANNLHMTNRMRTLTNKRNHRINDYMHKVSGYITNYAKTNHVTLVVIGHNKLQKQEINMGGVTNQNFVSVPHNTLISYLAYKLQTCGIKVVLTEESYTSQANFIGLDKMPIYGKKESNPIFSGTRIKRGLYKTNSGLKFNADLNGAANILRKVFPNVNEWDMGVLDMPVVANFAF